MLTFPHTKCSKVTAQQQLVCPHHAHQQSSGTGAAAAANGGGQQQMQTQQNKKNKNHKHNSINSKRHHIASPSAPLQPATAPLMTMPRPQGISSAAWFRATVVTPPAAEAPAAANSDASNHANAANASPTKHLAAPAHPSTHNTTATTTTTATVATQRKPPYIRTLLSVPSEERNRHSRTTATASSTGTTASMMTREANARHQETAAAASAIHATEMQRTNCKNDTRVPFSVCQWNVLTRKLATPTFFAYAEPSVLEFSYRAFTILSEFDAMPQQPDVLGCEELSDYWTFFKGAFAARGYDSVYVKRPSLHSSPSSWNGEQKMDGTGIFFKRDRFVLLHTHAVEFKDRHDRVAMCMLLFDALSRNLVIVAATHLHWDAKELGTQLAEVRKLAKEVMVVRTAAADRFCVPVESIPLFVMGDFNNGPGSKIYEHMTRAFLQRRIAPDHGAEGEKVSVLTKNGRSSSSERVRLRSAYSHYRSAAAAAVGTGVDDASFNSSKEHLGEPPHTTVNCRRQWTIDYIFYSTGASPDDQEMKAIHPIVTGLLSVPDVKVLREERGPKGWVQRVNAAGGYKKMILDESLEPSGVLNGIPNSRFGSDHLPILATFSLYVVKTPLFGLALDSLHNYGLCPMPDAAFMRSITVMEDADGGGRNCSVDTATEMGMSSQVVRRGSSRKKPKHSHDPIR